MEFLLGALEGDRAVERGHHDLARAAAGDVPPEVADAGHEALAERLGVADGHRPDHQRGTARLARGEAKSLRHRDPLDLDPLRRVSERLLGEAAQPLGEPRLFALRSLAGLDDARVVRHPDSLASGASLSRGWPLRPPARVDRVGGGRPSHFIRGESMQRALVFGLAALLVACASEKGPKVSREETQVSSMRFRVAEVDQKTRLVTLVDS